MKNTLLMISMWVQVWFVPSFISYSSALRTKQCTESSHGNLKNIVCYLQFNVFSYISLLIWLLSDDLYCNWIVFILHHCLLINSMGDFNAQISSWIIKYCHYLCFIPVKWQNVHDFQFLNNSVYVFESWDATEVGQFPRWRRLLILWQLCAPVSLGHSTVLLI